MSPKIMWGDTQRNRQHGHLISLKSQLKKGAIQIHRRKYGRTDRQQGRSLAVPATLSRGGWGGNMNGNRTNVPGVGLQTTAIFSSNCALNVFVHMALTVSLPPAFCATLQPLQVMLHVIWLTPQSNSSTVADRVMVQASPQNDSLTTVIWVRM